MKYAFIRAHRTVFSVRTMCRVLMVHVSGFYLAEKTLRPHPLGSGEGYPYVRACHAILPLGTGRLGRLDRRIIAPKCHGRVEPRRLYWQ